MKSSLDLINEFEKTFQVEKWTVNNIHIWPAIRIPLLTAWEQSLYYEDNNINNTKLDLPYRVLSELKQIILAIFSYKIIPKGIYKVGVWGLDVERVLIQGKYYSPYGDALRDLEFENELLCIDLTIKNTLSNHYPCADMTLGYFINRYLAKIYSIIKIRGGVEAPLKVAEQWCHERGLPSVGLT